MRTSHAAYLFSLLFLFASLLSLFCGKKSTTEKYFNLNDTVKYVGKEVCATCHTDKLNTFIHTGMGQSFGIATKEKSAAIFNEHTIVYDKFSNFYYKPFWSVIKRTPSERDSELFVMEFRLQGKDTVHKRMEKISYIIGSGQHTNSHIMNINSYLYQVPITFYTQRKIWDMAPGFENGNNTRFSRIIGLECMSCHNAMPTDFVHGSENKFLSLPSGIDCERCHGPGELHVKDKRAGHIVDVKNEIDYTIVNPAKLPVDLQFDICQRCHLQGTAVLKEGKTFTDFRPGMKLSDVMDVFLPKYKGAEDEFIMASHPDRLRMSKCFLMSQGTGDKGQETKGLTCITCHNPHVSVTITGKDVFNNACKNCHKQPEITCMEEMSTRLAVEDNCAGCHMPKAGTLDIPHVITTDHFIRSVRSPSDKPVAPSEIKKQKEFIALVCMTEKSPSAQMMAEGYLSYYEKFSGKPFLLDSAEKFIQSGLLNEWQKNFSTVIRFYFLKENYNEVVRYASQTDAKKITDAWTNYRIGESYSHLGRTDEAVKYLERAVNLAPATLDFRNKLGSAYAQSGKLNEAKNIFEKILSDNPKFTLAWNNLGFTEVLLGNLTEAEEDFKHALELSPDDELALANLSSLYINTKKFSEAEKLAKKLLTLQPKNLSYQKLLEAGREK